MESIWKITQIQYKICTEAMFSTYLSACSLCVPLKFVSETNCVRNVLAVITIFFPLTNFYLILNDKKKFFLFEITNCALIRGLCLMG